VKILDITEFYSERGGGIRSHLTTRGHVLCQLGHDHVVIAPGPRDEESPARETADASQLPAAYASNAPSGSGAHHVPRVLRVAGPALPYDRTYHLLGRLDKIRALAIAEHPDVLEAHSPYLATAAVLACGRTCARVRTAFWHADHLGVYVEPSIARVLGERTAQAVVGPLWVGVRALLAPYDAAFVAGVAQADRLRAAGVPRVVHVPFGVDRRTFHPGERDVPLRRALTGGAPGPLLVGVGRFAFEKRWDVVLDAFARVRARQVGDARATLVLFGDGPERARLERRAPPGVRFAGFERDPRALGSALATADVLVHGCPYETFGLATAEAVACGLPIVVPDRGGAVESADPSCSETYRSLDAGACAAAIERVLARGRRDADGLRARALEASARVPTVAEHFARVLAIYDELLEARRDARGRRAGKRAG
jgi:alpha-1,6-mannosyltransferase